MKIACPSLRLSLALLILSSFLFSMVHPGFAAESKDVILATTTSTVDSGLLDVLIPMFEKKTGYRVKTIAVGTGQALAIGEWGDTIMSLMTFRM